MTLTVAMLAIILQHLLLILLAVHPDMRLPWISLCEQLLTVISFITLNMAIYQLYNSTKTRDTLYFYSLLLVTLLLAFIQLQIPNWLQGTERQVQLLQNIGLELYLFILVLIALVVIPPRIGQSLKYQTAIIGYLLCHIAHILNQYVMEEPILMLSLVEYYVPILQYFILFLFLFDRIVELMHTIYRSSITDGLTGLYNRKYVIKRISQYTARELPVFIMFCDIDNFKKLNDTRGHQAGDNSLRQVAQILLEESEQNGVVGRYGGEEMIILVTDNSVKPGELGEKIRQRVEQEAGVTVSIGYSKYRQGQTAEELIREADQAMYHAKSTGKNKVVKFSKSMAKS
jgi:diguanylate cyclase (GGDEF)-like protein